MSAKIMGEVWELDLPFNKAWVLMAMGDHAHHDGTSVHPRIKLVAWKTGYSIPSVKRLVAELRADGILIPTGRTPFGVIIYRIELSHVPRKQPFVEIEAGRPVGRMERTPRKREREEDSEQPSLSLLSEYFESPPAPHSNHLFSNADSGVLSDEEWEEEFGSDDFT